MRVAIGRCVAGVLISVGCSASWVIAAHAQEPKPQSSPEQNASERDVLVQFNSDGRQLLQGSATNVAEALLSISAVPQVGTHWIGVNVVPADATLPGVGNVLERVADEVDRSPGEHGEQLRIRVSFA